MKIAVISDIHSNLEALNTALNVASDQAVDAIICLGDIVGYGADPAACVDLVRAHCAGVVRGNHDEAVSTENGLAYLPQDGQIAAKHNREQLSSDQLDYLAKLPLILEAYDCTFVHATPYRPAAWLRLDSYQIAQQQFAHFNTDICFVGHTHIPAIMSSRLGILQVRPGNRYLINVGSVGQPRDGNPRTSLGIFDTDSYQYTNVRVSYDVEGSARRIMEAGLPDRLAKRLILGR